MPKGSKTCPQCSENVGPRTKLCKCGHEFVQKEKIPKKTPEKIKVKSTKTSTLIYTPAGKCPIKLKSSSLEDIKQWVNKVREIKKINGGVTYKYSKSAVLYFIEQFFPCWTKSGKRDYILNAEYKKVYTLVEKEIPQDAM